MIEGRGGEERRGEEKVTISTHALHQISSIPISLHHHHAYLRTNFANHFIATDPQPSGRIYATVVASVREDVVALCENVLLARFHARKEEWGEDE